MSHATLPRPAFRWLALALAVLPPAFAGPAAPAAPWTLVAAVAQACTASPEARLADARIAASEAAAALADSASRPRLDLRTTYLQTNQPMQAFGAILNQGTFASSINFNQPGQIDAFTAGLYARYALYTGGRVAAERAAAHAGNESALADRTAALARLATEVVRAYFDIRQARAAQEALAATLAAGDENLRIGRLREDAGQLLGSERLNLEVESARTKQQLLAARYAGLLAERRFAFLLGLPAGTLVELASDDATLARLTAPTEVSPPGAVAQRPEVLALQHRVAAAENRLRAAQGALRPTVGAFAGVQADHGWRREGAGESWTAGVSAELPIFDGAENRSRIRAAEADLAAARAGLAQLELSVSLECEQAQLALDLAREQLALAVQIVTQTEASARLSRERFTAGVLLSAELIGVESRLADARLGRIQAEVAERTAIAELRRAAGLPLFDQPSP